ncbi:exodeoxyribonuclease VII large subunit [Hydrogeniiclostridium mannosilyticum]|uniref:Exodeoxyribonuclease 7 large subunit n=1 Tax=Hydrogeniiclostridium mannosilyticum TaxID=2764322 RepID=A0A328UCC6_9FIRM|nr:exodeoxyribonuclease VII large subunit [Hydrogeniiclostridium mannosilyticum]RAQ22519.1 exodeoxyribonuclease VII large subunit [Hydrogeniiclostridium mannosilyticum]
MADRFLTVTVSQLNTYLRSKMEEDPLLSQIFVVGEISNFTNHYKSGHLYFSLKDDRAVVKAVMFAQHARRLRFVPENGMKVLVRGRVSIYEAGGQYQIYAEDMQPDGLGALNMAYEQLKKKLEAEGLFAQERKKTLPLYPQRIGVITSPTGAAVHDILSILARRFPVAEVVFCPVLVQGEGAAPQLVRALRQMNRYGGVEIIIIGRGGGSLEDLWAFNEESVARAVADSRVPVISAVGHETDYTICDFVADVRAPTPSAAAELAVPEQTEILFTLRYQQRRMAQNLRAMLESQRQRLDYLLLSSPLQRPELLTAEKKEELAALWEQLQRAEQALADEKKKELQQAAEHLQALSPLAVLGRGFSVVYGRDHQPLKSARDVERGERLEIILSDGTLLAKVEEKRDNNGNQQNDDL